jgi:hypothetical protein
VVSTFATSMRNKSSSSVTRTTKGHLTRMMSPFAVKRGGHQGFRVTVIAFMKRIMMLVTRGVKSFFPRCRNCVGASTLVHRHHLHSDAPWLPLPGRGNRLGDTEGFVLVGIEHHGRGVPPRGIGRGDDQVW